jgi:hypothetical protein
MKASNPGSPNAQPRRNAGDAAKLPLAHIPLEWMSVGSWRLPSGVALAEFALQAGFLAPLLFGTGSFRRRKNGPASGPTTLGSRGLTKEQRG